MSENVRARMTENPGRILLTGATGFLGSHCLNSLLRLDSEIHAANVSGTGPHEGRVVWHGADLREADAAQRLVERVAPTHLLHNAWIATPGRFWSDPDNLRWLQGGLGLLRGFANAGGHRFVGVGTCAEYDWSLEDGICREDETPIRPSTLYGKAKAAMWSATQAFAHGGHFSSAWGRVFLPYGPGDTPGRLLPSLVASLTSNRPFSLKNNVARDFVFAPDVGDMLAHLLIGEAEGAFNVGSGEATRLLAAAGYVADRLGRGDLLSVDAGSPVTEPDLLVADMSKVEAVLGWRAPTTIAQGLEAVVQNPA